MSREITCVLIDDEQLAIDTLKWQLSEFCDGIAVLATFTNPSIAAEYLQKNKVDVCFLDIDMPEMSGFEFLSIWQNTPPFDVIFTTAYSEYAIQAFKVSALDYLLKPIDEDDLIQTIGKYKKLKKTSGMEDQLNLLIQQMAQTKSYSDRIAFPTIEGIHIVDVEDIIRLEADNNYTTIHLNGSKILVSKTLKEVESLLNPEQYFRIHQSHTINIKMIKFYQRGRGGNVTLEEGTILPVSKGRKEALLKLLGM